MKLLIVLALCSWSAFSQEERGRESSCIRYLMQEENYSRPYAVEACKNRVSTVCLQTLSDRNIRLDYALKYCADGTNGHCLKYLIEEENYITEIAVKSCKNVRGNCVGALMSNNVRADYTMRLCQSNFDYVCFEDLMSRRYNTDPAITNCGGRL